MTSLLHLFYISCRALCWSFFALKFRYKGKSCYWWHSFQNSRMGSEKYRSTSVFVVNLFWNLRWVLKSVSTDWWSIFLCGVVLWLIQVLASATSPEQVPSAETFFSLVTVWLVQGLKDSKVEEHRGMTVIVIHNGTAFERAGAFSLPVCECPLNCQMSLCFPHSTVTLGF